MSDNKVEKLVETSLFASRWLMAPVFLGLAFALLALGVKFFQEVIHMFSDILHMGEADLVLSILALIDMALIGALIVMVMFSGYENFISRIDLEEDIDKPAWLGKLDAGTLKLKVAASIVAISSIHLLSVFMKVQQIANDKILWYVVLHMTFVVSAVMLGLLDRMTFAAHRDHK
jgi:uncharacterized protein (TIGR00645 family)